jgi:O-antigen/teichoic acid export membrane protein
MSSGGPPGRPRDDVAVDPLRAKSPGEAAAAVDTTAEVVVESLGSSAPRAGGLVRAGSFVAFAVIATNALNAVFQFVMARILAPSEYSLLATLFVVVLISTVPLSGIQASVAREVAQRRAAGDDADTGVVLRAGLRRMRWILIGLLVLGALAAIPLVILFGVDRPLPFLACAAALAATLPLPVIYGALQGAEQFKALSFTQPFYSVLKLVLGALIGVLGFGASAVLFGVTVATAASLAVGMVPLRKALRQSTGRPEPSDLKLFGGYAAMAAVGTVGYAVHTSADVVVARLSFNSTTAGLWAAASVTAKTVLLTPAVVTTVIFPRVSVLRDRERERSHLSAALGIVLGLALVTATLIWLFRDQIVDIAFGQKYAEAAQWMGPLSFVMVLYALVAVYLFHFLALGVRRYAVLIVVFLAVQFGLFAVLHSTPDDLIIVQGIAAGLLVISGEVTERTLRRQRPVPARQ